MKRPMVTAQQKTIGQLGRRRWSDSVVAQQLIPAKTRKSARQIRRRVEFCPMHIVVRYSSPMRIDLVIEREAQGSMVSILGHRLLRMASKEG